MSADSSSAQLNVRKRVGVPYSHHALKLALSEEPVLFCSSEGLLPVLRLSGSPD